MQLSVMVEGMGVIDRLVTGTARAACLTVSDREYTLEVDPRESLPATGSASRRPRHPVPRRRLPAVCLAPLARVFDPAAAGTDAILTSLRRFYFDTALSSGAALPTLRTFASPGHILFGTDFPYDHGVSAAFTAALDSADILTAEDQTAISHGNAQALFPRLAA